MDQLMAFTGPAAKGESAARVMESRNGMGA
jgi:hypothetical protein